MENASAKTTQSATVTRGGGECAVFSGKGFYEVECLAPDGSLKWKDTISNLMPTAGLNDVLDKYWKGSAYTAAHYVGLLQIAGSPVVAAGDTMSSHAGWTEFTVISESPNVRQTLTLGSVSAASVDNSASKATFTIGAISPQSQNIDGCFITTNATLGGTTGTLVSAGLFTGGSKSVSLGDTLNVTFTNSMTSA